MGDYAGRAQTRAVDAEEYSQEFERYKTIVETVHDGIYITDENSRFTLSTTRTASWSATTARNSLDRPRHSCWPTRWTLNC